ncbi:862_t:CDS:2, partial [Racocetra persica]
KAKQKHIEEIIKKESTNTKGRVQGTTTHIAKENIKQITKPTLYVDQEQGKNDVHDTKCSNSTQEYSWYQNYIAEPDCTPYYETHSKT